MRGEMSFVVEASLDAADVLRRTDAYLGAEPDRHNLVLSLLAARASSDEAGRYWIVRQRTDASVVGVVFQSPLTFGALVTSMTPEAAMAAADAVADAGVTLPSVQGEVPGSAAFAGRWSERFRIGARPVQGTRLYRLDDRTFGAQGHGPGHIRVATTGDLALVSAWMDAFADDLHEGRLAPRTIEQRVEDHQVNLYEVDGRAVCLVAQTPAVAATVRIAPVYTPPEFRRHGFARDCVGEVSRAILEDGHICVLFADLANATANRIYHSLGYRAIAEVLRYEFDTYASPSRSTAAQ